MAKVYSTVISNDTVNWNIIKGSFVADSAYQYIIIGNFFNDNSTDTLIFDSNPNCLGAYYFVDDVCLSTDSSFAYNYIPAGISAFNNNNDKFKIYPNPVSNTLFLIKPFSKDNYSILNAWGLEVKKGMCDNIENSFEVFDLENGMYFLILRERKFKFFIIH